MKEKIVIQEDLIEYPIQLILSSNGFITIVYEKENHSADTVMLSNNANLNMGSIQENVEFSDEKHCVVFQMVKSNFSNRKKELFLKAYCYRTS